MLAGEYVGPVGALSVRSPSPTVVSRMGSGIRESIADSHLQNAGLRSRGGVSMGRLGDPNLCTDPGWQVAQALVGAAGGLISGAGGTDRGWAAAGGAATGVASSWAATCAAQAAAGQAQAGAASGAAQQAALNAQLTAFQQQQAADSIRIARDQQARAAADQQRTTMFMIAGGVAVLGLGAILLLRR